MPDESIEKQVIDLMQEDQAWEDGMSQAIALIKQEDFEAAMLRLQDLAKLAEDGRPHYIAMAAERLGYCLHKTGRLAEAEAQYRIALSFCTRKPLDTVVPEKYKRLPENLKPSYDKLVKLGRRTHALNNRRVLARVQDGYEKLLVEQARPADMEELRKITDEHLRHMSQYDYPELNEQETES